MRPSTQERRASFLIEQYFVINMVLSCFTARSTDDCWFRCLPTFKSACLLRFFALLFMMGFWFNVYCSTMICMPYYRSRKSKASVFCDFFGLEVQATERKIKRRAQPTAADHKIT